MLPTDHYPPTTALASANISFPFVTASASASSKRSTRATIPASLLIWRAANKTEPRRLPCRFADTRAPNDGHHSARFVAQEFADDLVFFVAVLEITRRDADWLIDEFGASLAADGFFRRSFVFDGAFADIIAVSQSRPARFHQQPPLHQ